jgi:hypothetical protein
MPHGKRLKTIASNGNDDVIAVPATEAIGNGNPKVTKSGDCASSSSSSSSSGVASPKSEEPQR